VAAGFLLERGRLHVAGGEGVQANHAVVVLDEALRAVNADAASGEIRAEVPWTKFFISKK
jgi:hypothetical protein